MRQPRNISARTNWRRTMLDAGSVWLEARRLEVALAPEKCAHSKAKIATIYEVK